MHARSLVLLFLLLCTVTLWASSKTRQGWSAQRYIPGEVTEMWLAETGKASWYGSECHGRPMANGKPFNMHHYTMASRTIPKGEVVTVVNIRHPECKVLARVTDYGPAEWTGRIADLSKKAMRKLRLVNVGVGEVAIYRTQTRVPAPPKPTRTEISPGLSVAAPAATARLDSAPVPQPMPLKLEEITLPEVRPSRFASIGTH